MRENDEGVTLTKVHFVNMHGNVTWIVALFYLFVFIEIGEED
jgi:hypothetical protein